MSDEKGSSDDVERESKPVDVKSVRIGPRELELPTDWDLQELDPANGITNRITDGSHHSPSQSDDGDYYYATVSDLSSEGIDYQNCGLINSDEYEKMVAGDCKPRKGEVLFSKDGTVGITTVFDDDEDVVLLSSIAMIDPVSDRLNANYLSQFLSSWFTDFQIQSLKSGTAIRRVVLVDIGKISIPIPPLREQYNIATVLHNIDQAIQKTERIKRQIECVRDGVRQDVFSHGIQESGIDRTDGELKDSYLGRVPENWQLRRVDEVCSHVVDCPHSTPDYAEEGTPVVRTSEIDDGRYYPTESPRVDEEGYKKRISRLEPKPGDVVFTREAPIGEAFKIPDGMKLCLGQRLMQLRPIDGILDANFLVELLYSNMMQSWFERSARGSTSTHVNVGDIESMDIPVPPIEEQHRIVDVLGGFREEIDSEQNLLSRHKNLKRGLMRDLLSGKVRTTNADIEVSHEVAQHG